MPAQLPAMLHAEADRPLTAAMALALAEQLVLARTSDPALRLLAQLCELARARRDRALGRRLTFSPKVFLPLTNLCRDYCDYCSFRRSPGDAGEWTMTRSERDEWLERAREQGASEALFCLGDRPESVFPSYRRTLAQLGCASTVDYLFESCQRALRLGLLPHTNAGLLSRPELSRLRAVNISMGLMLESSSERLCGHGMPHHRAPDKRPARRLQMMREAGELKIPFTTGILLGIGETARERVESLLEIRTLHAQHGHIQEVIVQRFRSHPDTPMAAVSEPADVELQSAIALARLILPDEVSVQSPPNLSPGSACLLIDAGIDDFGGISAVTPDYVNPRHPWPHIASLHEECAARGFTLQARSALHERFVRPELVDPGLLEPLAQVRARLVSFRAVAAPRVTT